MTDPNDNFSVDIKDASGRVVDTHTCRPVPTFGTPAWDECIREIEGKIKNATGQ